MVNWALTMKDPIFLIFHLLPTLAKMLRPGGSRTIIAENLLLKQQLLIHSRSRERAPNLTVQDRVLLGFWSLFLNPKRIARAAIIKRSTLMQFHTALKKRKYRLLYSIGSRKPGPRGPSKEVINAIVDMKKRNPRFGCPRIAQQINLSFGLNLNKDVVRRILATHYRRDPSNRGPSWLTTLCHGKDSLWSVDLFRYESIVLNGHWVMVVMDLYTRRIIGFGLHDGHDPLFQYHRCNANMRVLDIKEIKSLPHVPMSHPFVERLIGSIRRELLDHTFFWTVTDLENKLLDYQCYYNENRTHSGRNGRTPAKTTGGKIIDINEYRWDKHCRGLFELPVAA